VPREEVDESAVLVEIALALPRVGELSAAVERDQREVPLAEQLPQRVLLAVEVGGDVAERLYAAEAEDRDVVEEPDEVPTPGERVVAEGNVRHVTPKPRRANRVPML